MAEDTKAEIEKLIARIDGILGPPKEAPVKTVKRTKPNARYVYIPHGGLTKPINTWAVTTADSTNI